MFSRFCSNKANAKAGHPAELGSGCSYSPLCGSVGCPALFMYFESPATYTEYEPL